MTKHPFIIHRGDCLEILRDMPDSSVDSVVTDPPYGLSDHKPGDVVACLTAWMAGEEYRPKKKGFMGRAWDSWVPGPEVWREVYRVLKPGGHVVAFAGSRTHDLMSMALRLAGFECRDTVMWVYGSGFTKSMDVSKAIDKARDDSADILRVTTVMADAAERLGVSRADVDKFMGTSDMGGWWLSRLKHRCLCPKWDQWIRLKNLLRMSDEMDAEVWRLNGRKGMPGNEREDREVSSHSGGDVFQHTYRVANPGTPVLDAARQWAGWGTALKPAFEPALLFRKPLDGNVAENVLAHGTGALNIDGCRVPHADQGDEAGYREKCASVVGLGSNRNGSAYGEWTGERQDSASALGRFPANLIHDGSPEVLAHFPDSNGAGPSLPRVKVTGYGGGIGSGESAYLGGERIPYNAGSASTARFFYCAKASKADRNSGGAKNVHPTVKPTDLMRYLCRLVTPPGGVVLDLFTGSGSTGRAAMLEGFRFVGCEMSDEYADIAEVRIRHAAELAQAASSKPSDITPTTGDLFEAA